jgi:photosystem II stability/assembly factor-like uncharacterized protein
MKNNFLFLFVMVCLFITSNTLRAQWIQTDCPYDTINCFAINGTNLFAGTKSSGIFLSTNNGTSWTVVNSGLANNSINALAVSGANLFAGTNGGVFLSKNNGTSWTVADSKLPKYHVVAFAVSGTNILVADSNIVYLSENSGTSWTIVFRPSNSPAHYSETVQALAISGTVFVVAMETWALPPNYPSSGIVVSSDNTHSYWDYNYGISGYTDVTALAVSGTNLFAGTSGGVSLSTDNGTTWAKIDSGLVKSYYMIDTSKYYYYDIPAFAVSGRDIFVVCDGAVYLSTNSGTYWTSVNSGLTNDTVLALAVSENYLFAGTRKSGVWRRPLGEMITSVENNRTNVPVHFSLSQNYPNPFNPSTAISFNLPSRSFVSLKIFDLLGREAATIVSEEMPAGSYLRQWNAAKMPSGVYFYRLQAGSFTETKKLVLLR